MKYASYISRVILRRPAVRELVPELKFILLTLHTVCESHVGVWTPSGLSDDTGLTPAALAGGMADLQQRSLIRTDESTGEIFILNFFRDNKFCGLARHKQALCDFRQIQSPMLRQAVLEAITASPECGLLASFIDNQ